MGASTAFQLSIWCLHRMMQDKDRQSGGGIGEAVEVMRELRRRKKEGVPINESPIEDEKNGLAEQHQSDRKEKTDGFVEEEGAFLGHYGDK